MKRCAQLEKMKIEKLIVNDKEICRFSEPVNFKNENHLFEIVRIGETMLLVNDEPISIVWHDNGPSSGHFYTLNGITIDENIYNKLNQFEKIIQKNVLSDEDLNFIFDIYKPLLKSGTYRIFHTPAHSFEVTNNFYNTRKLRGCTIVLPEKNKNSRPSLYLVEGVFMFTQSIETLKKERIEFYKEQILANENPTIITLGMQPADESVEDVYSQFVDSYPQFIIDGHHKALAYQAINKANREKGHPYEISVPSIYSIVKIPIEDEKGEVSANEREKFLSKMLLKEEVSELIKFYNNW